MKRAILVVLDSVGVGELQDAKSYGDEGSHTLDHVYKACNGLEIKELEKLGIDNSLILEEINKIDEYIWIEKVKKIIEKRKKSNKLNKKMFVLKTKAYLNNLGYYKKTIEEVINCIEINEDIDVIKNEYEKVKRKLSRKYEGQKLKEKIKLSLYNKGYNLENILEIINNDLEK